MAVRMAQFRYYGEKHPNNQPLDNSWATYCTQETFRKYSPITQLGIQTLPGTRFYINSGITPIIIGATGVFELDTTNTSATITGLRIDQSSMELIKNLDNGHLIIDIVYGQQEEDET